MTRSNLRLARRFAAPLLLLAACTAPGSSSAQTLAERVAAAPDGAVRFSFPSREGVCETREGIGYRDPAGTRGRITFFGRNTGRDTASACVHGPIFVELEHRGDRVTAARARVGGAPEGGPAAPTELGRVTPAEAARYLLSVGREAEESVARVALAAAAFAEGVDLAPDLLRLARDEDRPRGTRDAAVFLVAVAGDRAAVRDLQRLVEEPAVDERVRSHAIFAIGQTQHAEDAAFLRALYPRLASERLKESAIFSISQGRKPDSERWLVELAANRAESVAMREKAIFWAAESPVSTAELDALYARLEEPALREQLIFAYSRRAADGGTDRLLRIARTDADPKAREKAVFWLGQAAGQRLADELGGLARDDSQSREFQKQAIFALSQRPRDEGVPVLLDIARTHRDAEVRKAALFWLGQTRDPRALDLFAEILEAR